MSTLQLDEGVNTFFKRKKSTKLATQPNGFSSKTNVDVLLHQANICYATPFFTQCLVQQPIISVGREK